VQRTSNDKIFVMRSEQEFDYEAFMADVESLVARSRSYELTDEQAVEWLRSLGFAIQ